MKEIGSVCATLGLTHYKQVIYAIIKIGHPANEGYFWHHNFPEEAFEKEEDLMLGKNTSKI